ncbi:unnamed protein product [Urochloa humidicola]
MVFPREQTPHPRHRPSIPLPATRMAVHAVPFSPRTSPPPSATPTPPPTPLNLPPFTTAFDPLNMLASSSARPAVSRQIRTAVKAEEVEEGPYYLGDLFHEPADRGKGVLGAGPVPARRASTPPQIPKARDIRMVGHASPTRPPSPGHGNTSMWPGRARSPRSPPSPSSTVPAEEVHDPLPGGAVDNNHEDEDAPLTATATDSAEEESVESDDLDDGPEYVEVWVAEGDWQRVAHFAYVELEPVTAAANPAPTIRGALLRAAPHLR